MGEAKDTFADDLIARVGLKVQLPSALTTRTTMGTFMVEALISTLDLSAPPHSPTLGFYYILMVFLFSINKFLIKGGNPEQFDGNPSVDKAFERLGLRTQYDPLPEMEVALMPHQTIGALWMLHKELSYFKSGGLGDDMGLGKVRLGRIFLTACPSVDTSFCRPSRGMRVPMSNRSVVDVSHSQDGCCREPSVDGSDRQDDSYHRTGPA